MKGIARKILHFLGLEAIARLIFMDSAPKENGWFKSVKTRQAVDIHGEAIPWLTYPFIDFIKDRIHKNLDIFEFGAGNSSIYYAKNAKSIISIEHSPEWHKIIMSNDKYNYKNLEVKLIEIPDDMREIGYHAMAFTNTENDYVFSLKQTGRKFNIVVVDGLFRNSCMMHSLDSLTDDGIIFLDNTSKHYAKDLKTGTDFLAENGFRRLDFYGMGPIYSRKSCTSIFYRDNNCFNI